MTLRGSRRDIGLPPDQIVGSRPPGGDGKIGETAGPAEASTTCGAGPGEGIAPGRSSRVTLILLAGRFELVCNLPGHYAAGMYIQLNVT